MRVMFRCCTFGPDTLETFLVTVEEWKSPIGRRLPIPARLDSKDGPDKTTECVTYCFLAAAH
jgi:hypothetical protein